MQSTRETIQQRNYERYEANRRFEEITDLAERIGYAIDTPISYELIDGHLHALTDTCSRPFYEQTLEARDKGRDAFTGNKAFEYTRLCHEHDEAQFIDAFARGEVEADIVTKLSRVPDAVVAGTTDIAGYRADLLRSFVRLYYREDNVVHCRLLSLDGNSQTGLEKVGELIDIEVGAHGSEDLLGCTGLLQADDEPAAYANRLAEHIKATYELTVFEETGQITYAGSQYENKADAHSLVAGFGAIVDTHMHGLQTIEVSGLDDDQQKILRSFLRKQSAAAVGLGLKGHPESELAETLRDDLARQLEKQRGTTTLSYGGSDSAIDREVQSGNYDQGCPTAGSTAEQMGMQQGKQSEWQLGQCRTCLRDTKVGPCSVCIDCEAADNRGEDLLQIHRRALAKQAAQQREYTTEYQMYKNAKKSDRVVSQPSKLAIIHQRYGEHAELRQQIGVGTAYTIIYDRRSGDVIATL